jgi:hypothetical protein
MSKREKLRERFLGTPKDFTFDEKVTLMGHMGYELDNKGKTSGSRVTFVDSLGNAIDEHRPHPGNVLSVGALKQNRTKLQNEGLI